MKFKIYHTKERIERAKNWLLKFYTKEKISCLVDFINEFFFCNIPISTYSASSRKLKRKYSKTYFKWLIETLMPKSAKNSASKKRKLNPPQYTKSHFT